jgi:hypothetical protein
MRPRAARQETSETVDMVIRRVRESVEGVVSARAFVGKSATIRGSRDDKRLALNSGDVAG